MKSYQSKGTEVKGSVTIINEGKLLETAASGLLKLSIELGFEVMQQLMELDVETLAGKKGQHNKERQAYRHGKERTKVVLGGEKRSADRPRVRSLSGEELEIPSLALFQNEDPLTEAVLARLLRGVSTRKYKGTTDSPAPGGSCASKSEVSRRFIAGLGPMVKEFLTRPLDDDYPAVMMDGMVIGGMTVLAAMGIRKDGTKQVLGVVEGGSENHQVVISLLDDLIDRGLSTAIPRLFVLDGGKALHKAVADKFGRLAAIQRCQVHKKRNVLSHLPKSEQTKVSLALSSAYLEFEYETARKALCQIADSLEIRYPKASASLREGLEETLTVHRLGIPGLLRQTLASTNAMESANSVCMGFARRIKNWQDGGMILRNITAGFMEAEKSFRRVKGYKHIPILTAALSSLLASDSLHDIMLSA